MTTQILGQSNPECPLCKKPFELASHSDHGLTRDFYFCKKDKVSIPIDDPMVGFWNANKNPEDDEEVPCVNVNCHNKMNVFCRSDGYMKAVCPNPKCGSEVEGHPMPDGHYDVRKGDGVSGIEITKSDARQKWKDN